MDAMDKGKMEAVVKKTFNTVSSKYDSPTLRFFPESAPHLASGIMLQGHEGVLDLATGTGHAGKPQP